MFVYNLALRLLVAGLLACVASCGGQLLLDDATVTGNGSGDHDGSGGGDGSGGDGQGGDGQGGDGLPTDDDGDGDPSGGDGGGGDGDLPGDVDSDIDCTCGGNCCDAATEECLNDACVPLCDTERCGGSGFCCPAETPVCAYDLSCQIECGAGEERCGTQGELCCDAGLTCGASNTCVTECEAGETLCGDDPSTDNEGICCPAGDVCSFGQCVEPGDTCESFLDCEPGEYCELILDPDPDTGLCLPDDFPDGVPACQRPGGSDLFAPQFDWHWLGIQITGSLPTDTDNILEVPRCSGGVTTNCYTEGCTSYISDVCFNNVTSSPVVADMDRVNDAALNWPDPINGGTVNFPAGRHPEVAFKAYPRGGSSLGSDGNQLVIVADGRNGTTKKVWRCGNNCGYPGLAIGNIDNDAKLEIVTAGVGGDADGNRGVRAIDPFYAGGDATNVSWYTRAGSMNIDYDGAVPSLADLNNDGVAEIVMGGVVLNGANGSVLADFGAGNQGGGGVNSAYRIAAIADIDLDGQPEVVTGNKAFNICPPGVPVASPAGVSGCSNAGSNGWTWGVQWDASALMNIDLNNDGDTGDASEVANVTGIAGIGNFIDNVLEQGEAGDPPEVAFVAYGSIWILNGDDGTVAENPTSLVDLRFPMFVDRAGAPNIADFDGDGRVEVSFAGAGCLVVVDVDCAICTGSDCNGGAAGNARAAATGCSTSPSTFTGDSVCTAGLSTNPNNPIRTNGNYNGVLWVHATEDNSSAATGTSVFDFQGDGKAEVLYGDECFLRVFDGESGDIVMETPNSSRTIAEYPIVVDIDGDQNSEIVLVSNHDRSSQYNTGGSNHDNRDRCGGQAPPQPNNPGSNYGCSTTATNAGQCTGTAGCFWKDNHGCKPNAYRRNHAVFTPAWCTCSDTATNASAAACNAAIGCTWTGSACTNGGSEATRPDSRENVCDDATWGVWTYGDSQDLWVKTLPHWPQHAYHVTEFDYETGNSVADWGAGKNNWDVYNNYRQNVQGFVPLNAPNLEVVSLTASLARCPTIDLNARVVNQGRSGIPKETPVCFYRLDESGEAWACAESGTFPGSCACGELPYDLLPGQGADVPLAFAIPSEESLSGHSFLVIANPDAVGGPLVADCALTTPADPDTDVFECNICDNRNTVLNLSCGGGG